MHSSAPEYLIMLMKRIVAVLRPAAQVSFPHRSMSLEIICGNFGGVFDHFSSFYFWHKSKTSSHQHQDVLNVILARFFRLSTVTLFKWKHLDYRKAKWVFTNTPGYNGGNLSCCDFDFDFMWFFLAFLVWWFKLVNNSFHAFIMFLFYHQHKVQISKNQRCTRVV